MGDINDRGVSMSNPLARSTNDAHQGLHLPISNYIHYKVWDEITAPFSNLNGCNIGVWDN